jgi:hypothetical protein
MLLGFLCVLLIVLNVISYRLYWRDALRWSTLWDGGSASGAHSHQLMPQPSGCRSFGKRVTACVDGVLVEADGGLVYRFRTPRLVPDPVPTEVGAHMHAGELFLFSVENGRIRCLNPDFTYHIDNPLEGQRFSNLTVHDAVLYAQTSDTKHGAAVVAFDARTLRFLEWRLPPEYDPAFGVSISASSCATCICGARTCSVWRDGSLRVVPLDAEALVSVCGRAFCAVLTADHVCLVRFSDWSVAKLAAGRDICAHGDTLVVLEDGLTRSHCVATGEVRTSLAPAGAGCVCSHEGRLLFGCPEQHGGCGAVHVA